MILQIPVYPPTEVLTDPTHSNLLLYICITALGVVIFLFIRQIDRTKTINKEKQSKIDQLEKEKDCETNITLGKLNDTLLALQKELQHQHEKNGLSYKELKTLAELNKIHIIAVENYLSKSGFEPIPWLKDA